jgi:tRNA/tmRNA/rRNA uracil-C5-methylase (TrmA/RlmC/RlmD family)
MLRCPHRPPCPGCPRFGEPGWPPGAHARLRALANESGLPAPALHEGAPFGWRHRARLAVRGRAASPKVGLFEAGTHRIVDTPRCAVHHPAVNAVAAALRASIRHTGTTPYHEASQRGLLRYVQIVIERESERAQVVLVCNDHAKASAEALAADLQARLGDGLHSLWWNGNTTRHNVILGPDWAQLSGPATVRERIAGVDVFYGPGAFGQANLPLADRLVERVADLLAGARSAVDLYAGTGAFGLPLLARGATVHFGERNPDAVAGLRAGIAARPAAERARAFVHAGETAGQAALWPVIASADAVVLDPPRKGAGVATIRRLAERPPERLVYVSCGLAAFEREARALLDAGRLELASLEAFALLPHTEHVETVACFTRAARRAAG